MKLSDYILKVGKYYGLIAMSTILLICGCPKLFAMEPIDPNSIPESEYVRVKDGHLNVNGERRRFWAVVGKVYGNSGIKADDTDEIKKQKVQDAYAATNKILDRLEDMACNSVRMWNAYPDSEYTMGDGSDVDCADYFISEAKRRGFKIWAAGFNRIGGITPENVDIIDDPLTHDGWIAGVTEAVQGNNKNNKNTSGWEMRNNMASFWDARIEALKIQKMKKIATHFNQHTGLRWCDDPVFAIWELSNEEWWVQRMLTGQWQRLPAYFRQTLFSTWHSFLKNKYQTQEKLKNAWGKMLPGEDLEKGTILFAPMAKATKTGVSVNDSNKFAIEALQVLKQEYESSDFPPARGSDILEFLVQLHLSHKQRIAEQIKPIGRSCNLSPMIYDTGIGYQIQSQWLHQNADAVAHDAYVNGWGPTYESLISKVDDTQDTLEKKRLTLEAERVCANDGKWVNWLLKPPGICQGVPWLEQNRFEGKPYLVYETQIQQPAKYRADFPLRIAALGCIQDWDWVTFHYFGDGYLNKAGVIDNPFEHLLDVTTGSHPQGYHLTYDEVQTSIMRGAGYIFRNNLWKKAPIPTQFIYGKKSLYDPKSMGYGNSYGDIGMDMLQTVYQYGVRIKIDPTREDDQVIGPVVKFDDRNTHNPYTPTDEITFDWKKGFFKAVSDKAVAYAGRVEAGSNLKLGNFDIQKIHVVNPEGSFSPVNTKRPYFAITIYSMDSAKLDHSDHIGISFSSTSYNTNYQMGEIVNGKVRGKSGTLPVLVSRPSAVIHLAGFAGAQYRMRDFNDKVIAEGKIGKNENLIVESSQPVWLIDLTR